HELADVPRFLKAAHDNPSTLVLGNPQFDESAPKARTIGRKLTAFWVRVGAGTDAIGDSMCGFRVYPVDSALRAGARGNAMDFVLEIEVRMVSRDVPVLNLPTTVRDYHRDAGVVSHFRVVRDNALISLLHARLTTTRVVRT